MSVEDNKALAHPLYDQVINQGNLDLIDDLSEGFVEHEPFAGLPTAGPEAPKATLAMFRAAFPDIKFTPHDMIAEGHKVAVRVMMSGTHKGELMGILPTNKSAEVQLIDILEIRGGKLTAHGA